MQKKEKNDVLDYNEKNKETLYLLSKWIKYCEIDQ